MDPDLWNATLSRHLSQIKDKKCAGLVKSLQLADFEASLQKIRKDHCSSRVNSYLDRLSPFISYIQSFGNAIDTLIQANPRLIGLIWGSLGAVLAGAAKYLDLLDKSTLMLRDITITLTRFDRYLQLLPNNAQLQSTLKLLYDDYVGFCIQLAIFLKRHQKWRIFLTGWSSINEKFQEAKESINHNIYRFEAECKVSVDASMVKGLNMIQQVLPKMQVTATVPLPFHDLRYPRNPKFVGRDAEIDLIDLAIRPIGTGIQSCAVHGLAGVGKSQVAIEYTHRYGSAFDYIFWLPAQEPVELASAFSSLYRKLLLGGAGDDQQSMIEAVKGLLARTPKWLLVFDNAQEWADISAYWPVTGNGSVLITIQNPAITQFVTRHIGLPSFSIQDSCKLLFKHLNLDDSTVNPRDLAVATVLSDDLGGLPMAIAHLAGYINQSQSSLESFKRQFHKRLNGANIWNAKSMATTAFHDAPLGALWDIALANLQHESRQLLDVISFLNPDEIHEEVMIGNEPDVKKVEDFNATIADLRRRCLINRYPNEKLPYISVHRALQRNITYKLDQDIPRYAASLGLAIDLVRQAFPRRNKLEIPDHHNWVLYERYIPHVVRLRNIAEEAPMSTNHSAALADLLTDAGHYLWHRGDMIGAKTALEAADSICRSIPEESSAITRASALAGLVAVDHALGGSARTQIELNNIEIVRLRSSYRSGDPETSDILLSNAWHDLGCTYLEIGNYDEAEKCLDRSLAIKINLGSETSMPFEFATEYEDMAYVRLSQGRSSDALRLIADAVRVAKMDEAANRCVILQFIFDWSVILLNSGHFQDALEKAQESLHGRDEVLGENAIHTLNSAYWVANCLYHLKRYAESESMLLSVIQKSKSSQWSLEAITRTRYRLIQVLLALNRDTEAQSMENDLRVASTQLVQKGVVFPASSSRSIDSFDHSVSIYFGRSTGQLYRVVAD